MEEVCRVLRPGSEFVFSDPMQANDADPEALNPILDRIHLDTLGSFSFYRDAAPDCGLQVVGIEDLTRHLIVHYRRVHDELVRRNGELAKCVSQAYAERMKTGLWNWVKAGEAGQLSWGVIHLRKPPD